MDSASHSSRFPFGRSRSTHASWTGLSPAAWRWVSVGAATLLISACSTLDGSDRTAVNRTPLPDPPIEIAPPPPPAPTVLVPTRPPKQATKPAAPKTPTQRDEAAALSNVADAVPRSEALKPWANRPYVNRGRRYVPMTRRKPFTQRGLASWYGRPFHGRKTAIGERYDMRAMTAAHPTLPLPSYVRVTSVETGESIVVRVNDRGPFSNGRIIDLSFAAAARLGFTDSGVAQVEIDLIVPPDGASHVKEAAPVRRSVDATSHEALRADSRIGAGR